MTEPLRLVVAVPTFKRPQTLAPNLAAVVDQTAAVRVVAGRPVSARVVVIDNDPQGSAASVAAAAGDLVEYAHEERPGIVAVRNRALEVAAQDDLLVFIDDDEIPQPGWLAELLRTWESHQPTAVWGRVLSVFEAPLDPWVAAGEFFTRKRRKTGTQVTVAASGNLLLEMAIVRRLGLRFDDRMAMGGGEDTLFTRELVAGGGRIVWCDESVAHDIVPADRANRQWVLARAVSHGNVAARVELNLANGGPQRLRGRVLAVVRGLARIAGGRARWLSGCLRGSLRAQARGLRAAARGRGMVAAGLGWSYQEYARTDGRKWQRG